jgi:hypothetical protein
MYGRDANLNEERKEDKAHKFIQRIQQVHQEITKHLEKIQEQYKARHDKHKVDHQFEVGDRVWLHISRERLKGEGNKIKPIHYGPFTILDKSGTNYFRLDLLLYMHIYSVVNIENLKLFEPPMIMGSE